LLGPTSLQSKVSTSIDSEAIPQASVLPPSTSAGVMVAFPSASKSIVISIHTAVGATLSSIVTIVVQVLEFPFTSVTVNVTVFGPTSAHVKVLGETANEAIPQLSVLPLSISAGVILAFPVASN